MWKKGENSSFHWSFFVSKEHFKSWRFTGSGTIDHTVFDRKTQPIPKSINFDKFTNIIDFDQADYFFDNWIVDFSRFRSISVNICQLDRFWSLSVDFRQYSSTWSILVDFCCLGRFRSMSVDFNRILSISVNVKLFGDLSTQNIFQSNVSKPILKYSRGIKMRRLIFNMRKRGVELFTYNLHLGFYSNQMCELTGKFLLLLQFWLLVHLEHTRWWCSRNTRGCKTRANASRKAI